MSNDKQRCIIAPHIIRKVVSNLSDEFINSLPGKPERIAEEFALRIQQPYFSPSISVDLREMMLEHRLSDEDYLITFFKILYHTFYNKVASNNPEALILLSQTGGGKSNLRERILRERNNIAVLDSDSYKGFRPDSLEIQQLYPQYYGALTGIDSYDHVQNIASFAMKNRYNFLIESAPSTSQGVIGLDLDELEQLGYSIHYDVLAIGHIVSQMGIHQRYEAMLRDEELRKTAKLTSIARHNDSYLAVLEVLHNSSPNSIITVYRRGSEAENMKPQIVATNLTTEDAVKTVVDYRESSNRRYISSHQFNTDYRAVQGMMAQRGASEAQMRQLSMVWENAKSYSQSRSQSDYAL